MIELVLILGILAINLGIFVRWITRREPASGWIEQSNHVSD